jgi:hypothetical protein
MQRAAGAQMTTEDFMEQMELVDRCLDEAGHMPRWLTHDGQYAHPPYLNPHEALKPAPVGELGERAKARLGGAALEGMTHWSLTCDVWPTENSSIPGDLYVADTTVHAGTVNRDGVFQACAPLVGPLADMHLEEV